MKIKKSDLLNMIQEQNDFIAKLIRQVNCHHKDIIRIEGVIEPEPQLKQLDQSVFKNMHERWRFAAISADGSAYRFNKLVDVFRGEFVYEGDDSKEFKFSLIGKGYDASNWQNSLIERDVAKELTGSELCKAMLERGDKWVVCFVAYNEKNINYCDEPSIVVAHDENGFYVRDSYYSCAVPVNRKGEPLTASEVGL